MFRLIVNVRRGSPSGMPQAWARYASVEDARIGANELLRDDRVVRVMIARNLIPPSAVEWVER
jgi:exonuclease I